MTIRRGIVLGSEAAELVLGEEARLRAQNRLLAILLWDAFKGYGEGEAWNG